MTQVMVFEVMEDEDRPQDEFMDGRDWTFTPLEHGGKLPDMMPQAILAEDSAGRECIYVPLMVCGRIGRFVPGG